MGRCVFHLNIRPLKIVLRLLSIYAKHKKDVVFHTGDSSHFSGAFQVYRIIIPQLSANDVNSLLSQLLDDLW